MATTEDISKAIENSKNSVITPNDLRLILMDYGIYNIPLYKEELTEEQLWKCIEWGAQSFNELPPRISTKYTIENFPDKRLLLDLATIEALKLTALKELRGEMQYNDGGIQSSINYKFPQFSSLRQELEQKTAQEASTIKRSYNVNSCYGALC